MSKVAYIHKSLVYVSKFPLNKNLLSVPRLNEWNKLLISRPISSVYLSTIFSTNNNPNQEFVTWVQLNSNVRQICCGQYVMCNTQKPHTLLDEQSGVESSSTAKDDLKQSDMENELNERIKLLLKEVEEFKDKYQRSLADRENLRHRLEKQISDSKLFGIQSFCKDLLEVSDIFRKALETVPKEKVKETDPLFIGLYDGVVMTENQLLSVFRRHGLQRIVPAEGDKFDPSVQEAMFEVPASEGKLPGTVAHVVRTGWKLYDRCVRSAQVGVVKN